MTNWEKLGLVFSPRGEYYWTHSHASLPVPIPLDRDRHRIFFASRDSDNRSHIGSVEVSLSNPWEGQVLAAAPVLSPGPLGNFDDHGVYAASIVDAQGALYLYFIGWNPGVRPPLFYSSVGLAVSDDAGDTFRRISAAPILARSEHDPCLVTSPFVLLDLGIWRMWYVSGLRWEESGGTLHSYYHIKYAESKDGISWVRRGHVCIDLEPGERNIARPCVTKRDGKYHMWYSYNRGEGYRIGYAESNDGYIWERQDERAGIDASTSGWDSEALAHPWVFFSGGQGYMLYNGNGFGRDGFGLARAIAGSG